MYHTGNVTMPFLIFLFAQGLVAPIWIGETMLNIIGHRETERALQLGKLYTPLEALSIGLVDAVAPLEQVDEEANIIMKQLLRIPGKKEEILLMRCVPAARHSFC